MCLWCNNYIITENKYFYTADKYYNIGGTNEIFRENSILWPLHLLQGSAGGVAWRPGTTQGGVECSTALCHFLGASGTPPAWWTPWPWALLPGRAGKKTTVMSWAPALCVYTHTVKTICVASLAPIARVTCTTGAPPARWPKDTSDMMKQFGYLSLRV